MYAIEIIQHHANIYKSTISNKLNTLSKRYLKGYIPDNKL